MSMLEIKNVHKSFFTYTKPRLQAGIFHRPGARKVTSELQVLRGVDLTVEKGDVVAILGPSGSGKTTLLRCLNFLEPADSGRLVFDGETFDLGKITKADIARLRKKTAFVFQNYNLVRNKTALQNVTEGRIVARKTPKEEADAIGRKMLETVGLAARADYYPRQLSGGQQQRVAIARALANDPQVLLCDEATSALDPQTTKAILRLLKHLNETLGITIVLITLEMAVVKEICDRVAVMEYGRVVEQGEVFTVFAEPKQDITKSFIHTTSNLQKVEELIAEDSPVTRLQPGELIVRLSYVQRNVNEPIISAVSQMFNVSLNIIFADITIVQDSPIGGTVAIISGERKQITKAIEYLIEKNVGVEVIKDARADR